MRNVTKGGPLGSAALSSSSLQGLQALLELGGLDNPHKRVHNVRELLCLTHRQRPRRDPGRDGGESRDGVGRDQKRW